MKRVKTSPRILSSLATPRAILATLVLVLATDASASPQPPPPIDELTAFYQAMDGDSWARNDHWLDEDVHHCDWYGIRCNTSISTSPIDGILLPDNNLVGDIAEVIDLLDDLLRTWGRADLRGNQISGELPALPLAMPAINLADNALTGPLPEVPDGPELDLEELDLSDNALTGQIPESWSGLELRHLKLSRNALEGSIEPALAALSLDESVHLDVAGNQFSGPIPDELLELMPYALDDRQTGPIEDHWSAAFPPGLNLCWNDFDPPEGELADFIDRHHHGGRFAGCQRPQAPIDPTISGSWFNPDRSGEGFVQQLLDNGRMLTFWFTYPRNENEGQRWFLGLAPAGDTGVWMEDLLAPVGRFGAGNREPENPREELDQTIPFRLSINRLDEERQHGAYSRSVVLGGSMTDLGSFGLDSLRFDQIALTRLAGTTCENQSEFQDYSGAWYNPERAGEGFVVEVLPDDEIVVYWFTFKPDDSGEQAWMIGSGSIEPAVILAAPPPGPNPVGIAELKTVHQPLGGTFGEGFDPTAVEFIDWGSLTLELLDDGSAHVQWDSLLEGFGTGGYPLEQLARPMLAECD